MIQRPPYVPKLHSSQIRTRVSGLTYESHTGLELHELKREEGKREVPKVVVAHVPFSVAFLAESADGCGVVRISVWSTIQCEGEGY